MQLIPTGCNIILKSIEISFLLKYFDVIFSTDFTKDRVLKLGRGVSASYARYPENDPYVRHMYV